MSFESVDDEVKIASLKIRPCLSRLAVADPAPTAKTLSAL